MHTSRSAAMSPDETSWLFPPALNVTFREAFSTRTRALNNSSQDSRPFSIIRAAVQDLTLPQRVDPGFRNDGWGGEAAVVRVGDTVSGNFKGTNFRLFGTHCILCTAGAGNEMIEHACSNCRLPARFGRLPSPKSRANILSDTENEHISFYSHTSGPYTALSIPDFPSLEQSAKLPNETCGLCIFILYEKQDTDTINDYSVPFPVLQAPGEQRRIFNATYPTGFTVPRTPYMPTNLLDRPSDASAHGNDSPNTKMIVGVVVGVLGGTVLLLGILWILWRKKKKMKRCTNSAVSTEDQTSGQAGRGTRNVALQRIQSLVRRPDSNASEVPPTYHEAVHGVKSVYS